MKELRVYGLKRGPRLQIGSFFMINLCLVVIATQFSETKKREMERMRLERARYHSTSTLASSTNTSEPTTCYAEIVKWVLSSSLHVSSRTLFARAGLPLVARSLAKESPALLHYAGWQCSMSFFFFQIHRPSLATGQTKTDEEIPPVAIQATAEAGAKPTQGSAESSVSRRCCRTESRTGW